MIPTSVSRALPTLVSGALYGRWETLAASTGNSGHIDWHAWRLAGEARRAPGTVNLAPSPGGGPGPLSIEVGLYAGTNERVLAVRSALEPIAHELALAVVHGSLGSNEEIAYSDFDALVVLKDECVCDAARLRHVAKALTHAQRFMVAQDPLQHHGWFALAESDFERWPEGYLPVAVLQHAQSLLGPANLSLSCQPIELPEVQLRRFCAELKQSLLRGRWRSNLFATKAVLSQFMLVPALHGQARTGRGVWKGDSFALARATFTEAGWEAMERVSAIRRAWERFAPRPLEPDDPRAGVSHYRARKRRYFPGNADLLGQLSDELVHSMTDFLGTLAESGTAAR